MSSPVRWSRFTSPAPHTLPSWHAEPSRWAIDADHLRLEPDADWSTQPFDADAVWLRIRREAADYIVDASTDGKAWEQIRMAHLFEDDGKLGIACGLYACSPKAAGFAAEFSFLEITAGRLPTP